MNVFFPLTSAIIDVCMIFGLYSIYLIFKILIQFRTFDELERKMVYQSFSISYLIVMSYNLILLILAFFYIRIPIFFHHGIGPYHEYGTYFESFLACSALIGLVYFLIKIRYGQYTKKQILKKVMIPWGILFVFFLLIDSFI